MIESQVKRGYAVNSMGNEVISKIKGKIPEPPEAINCSDLNIFKPRFFVEGKNQFNFYHFAIPRVYVSGFFTDKKEHDMPKDTILATNPGQKLMASPINKIYNDSDDVKFFCLFIEPNKIRKLSKEEHKRSDFSFSNNVTHLSSNLMSLISKLEFEYKNSQPGHKFMLECLSMEITISLMRELRSNMAFMPELRKYSSKREINMAIDFLWESADMEFSLDKLCKTVNLSPYYFERLFKDHTGKTPYEYYMDIKNRKALEYLKTKAYSITEVCFILGFSSHSHFTSVFRKRLGITPSEYIKSI